MEVEASISLVKEMRHRSIGGVDFLFFQIPKGGFWTLPGYKHLSTLENNQALWGVGRRELENQTASPFSTSQNRLFEASQQGEIDFCCVYHA